MNTVRVLSVGNQPDPNKGQHFLVRKGEFCLTAVGPVERWADAVISLGSVERETLYRFNGGYCTDQKPRSVELGPKIS